jgi:hypothetical protein
MAEKRYWMGGAASKLGSTPDNELPVGSYEPGKATPLGVSPLR